VGAVLFDIGSTLVQGPALSPAKVLARLIGLPDEEKDRVADIIMCRTFDNHHHLYRELQDSFPAAGFSEAEVKNLWLDQETAPREIPGATGAVRRVKNFGFKVGLVSDIWPPYYRGFLAACPELAAMVDFSCLSYRERMRKPSPAMLEKALRSLGVSADRAWMIGDTYSHDLLPAIKMGMRTVWVLNRPENEHYAMEGILKGRLARPDYIVDNIADLAGIDFREGRKN